MVSFCNNLLKPPRAGGPSPVSCPRRSDRFQTQAYGRRTVSPRPRSTARPGSGRLRRTGWKAPSNSLVRPTLPAIFSTATTLLPSLILLRAPRAFLASSKDGAPEVGSPRSRAPTRRTIDLQRAWMKSTFTCSAMSMYRIISSSFPRGCGELTAARLPVFTGQNARLPSRFQAAMTASEES